MQTDLLESFECLAGIILPELFSNVQKDWVQEEPLKDSASFILNRPLEIDAIVSVISRSDWDICLLYDHAVSADTDFGRRTAFYSVPTESHMFIINAQADPSGLVSQINVSVFDSIDNMLYEIRRQKRFIDTMTGVMKASRSNEDILIDFMLL